MLGIGRPVDTVRVKSGLRERKKRVFDTRDIFCLLMRLKVCPYQYVGEGNPDKMGDENFSICKECVKLVIIMNTAVTKGNRCQGAELREIK